MRRISWRAPAELVERVRAAADAEHHSVNEFLTRLAEAATNPDLAEDDMARTRERLPRAGLLVEPGRPRIRPDPADVAAARVAVGGGTPPGGPGRRKPRSPLTVIADSSALVELYAEEVGNEHVRAIGRFVVAQIVRVEVPAALWAQATHRRPHRDAGRRTRRRVRGRPVRHRRQATSLRAGTEELAGPRGRGPAHRGARARRLRRRALRTARAVQGADPAITRFAAFDRSPCDAAAAESSPRCPEAPAGRCRTWRRCGAGGAAPRVGPRSVRPPPARSGPRSTRRRRSR